MLLDIDRVKKIMLICLSFVTITGLVLGNLAYLFSDQLLGIYSKEAEVIATGKVRVLYVCSCYFLCGLMDVMVGVLRGIGYSVMPMIVSLLGACGTRLVWIATIFQVHHETTYLYFSYPLSWAITFSVHLLCYIIVHKKAFAKVIESERP